MAICRLIPSRQAFLGTKLGGGPCGNPSPMGRGGRSIKPEDGPSGTSGRGMNWAVQILSLLRDVSGGGFFGEFELPPGLTEASSLTGAAFLEAINCSWVLNTSSGGDGAPTISARLTISARMGNAMTLTTSIANKRV